jgi:hypothetical protein
MDRVPDMPDAEPNDDLRALAARITAAQGPGLFPAMAQYLASLLQADEVLVGESVDEFRASTLGVSLQGAVLPNYTLELAGTPFDALLRAAGGEDAATPGEEPANGGAAPPEAGADYFGLTLQDAQGAAIGFVCARSATALGITEHQHCLIEIVAVLLTTELQRLRSERQREQLDGQVRRLQAELDARERGEVVAAATGLHQQLQVPPPLNLDDSASTGLHHVQREHILRILNATRWVIEGNSGAALKLGMKPATLRHRMKKLGIERSRLQT